MALTANDFLAKSKLSHCWKVVHGHGEVSVLPRLGNFLVNCGLEDPCNVLSPEGVLRTVVLAEDLFGHLFIAHWHVGQGEVRIVQLLAGAKAAASARKKPKPREMACISCISISSAIRLAIAAA